MKGVKVNCKGYTPEEDVEAKKLVQEIDESIDLYVEEFQKDKKSILIATIIKDIALEMEVNADKLRSFLRQNGSKYLKGITIYALLAGKPIKRTLFIHYKAKILAKLRKNEHLEEIYADKLSRGLC